MTFLEHLSMSYGFSQGNTMKFLTGFNDTIYHGNNKEVFKKTDSGLDREVRKKLCM